MIHRYSQLAVSAIRVLFRASLIPCLLLCVSMPSWTATLLADGISIEEARGHYMSLETSERQLIHERYKHFTALSAEEQEDLRTRGRNLARISRENESHPLPVEVKAKLEELSPREQRNFKQTLLEAELREKGRELLSSLSEASRRELEAAEGARARAKFMRRYKHQNVNRVINAIIRRVGKRLEVPQAEIDQILALRKSERLPAFLALNEGLTEEELLRTGLPFGISPAQWEAWRDFSGEEFFEGVVQHRERVLRDQLAKRRRAAADSEITRPEPKQLEGLAELLVAFRKRPRDFVELADVERGRKLRLELGKRKRALCQKAIEAGELTRSISLVELEYMSDSSFFALVRRIIEEAGGPERIDAWATAGEPEPR